MNFKEGYVYGIEQLSQVAQVVLDKIRQRRIALFIGEVGAGKTTLIKEICQLAGVGDEVSSPTFALVNEYDSDLGPIYHMDLYRLGSEAEMFEAGITEYLDSGHICMIEWPDLVMPLMTQYDHAEIELSHVDGTRRIVIRE